MNPTLAALLREGLFLALWLAAPPVLAAVAAGFVAALLQSAVRLVATAPLLGDPSFFLGELRERLPQWVDRVAAGAAEVGFTEAVRDDLAEARGDLDAYEQAMPFWQSYAGLKRFVEKRGLSER